MERYLKEKIDKIDCSYFVNSIREIAKQAIKFSKINSLSLKESLKEAKFRVKKPVDYLRCAEFPIVFQHLEFKDGMKILDVGSPQWFSIFLAKDFPSIKIFYVNILKEEIDLIKGIAKSIELRNIDFFQEDVRKMNFPSEYFDWIFSISAIEHVAPEENGDFIALREMSRVLKNNAKITISLPFKEKPRIIYLNSPVYERKEKIKNFFAREYSLEKLKELFSSLNFEMKRIDFIIEKKGFFALDYWNWGGGRGKITRIPIIGFLKAIEMAGLSLEYKLAKEYLFKSASPLKSTVCAVLTLEQRKDR
ncbi:MAG: SAM-dependent methyltransferase [Candidatus Aminicenantia bacterium]